MTLVLIVSLKKFLERIKTSRPHLFSLERAAGFRVENVLISSPNSLWTKISELGVHQMLSRRSWGFQVCALFSASC